MKRVLLVALPFVTLLSGCALISDPMPMGNDVYTLHATGGTYSSQAGLKSDLWKEATEFCAKQGKTPVLLNQGGQSGHVSYNAPSGYAAGSGFGAGFASSFGSIGSVSYPEADIVFRCVAPAKTSSQPVATGTAQPSSSRSWAFVYIHPKIGAQAVDLNSITTDGDIKRADVCFVMAKTDDAKNIYTDTMECDCRKGEYRNTDPQLYINGHHVDAPKPLVAELTRWTKPSSGAPGAVFLKMVCDGPSAEQRQSAVVNDDPVRFGYLVHDYLEKGN